MLVETTTPPEPRRYPYKAPAALLLAQLVVAACAVGLAHIALHNDRALRIFRVIRLGVAEATIFFWILAGLSGATALLGILRLVQFQGRYVLLADDAISAPGPLWSPAQRTVRFDDVKDVRVEEVHGHVFLAIRHPRGKLDVARAMVGDQAFAEILAAVQRGHVRSGSFSNKGAEA